MQANAVKRTPEQLGKALAAAQAEVEALKQRLALPGSGAGSSGDTPSGTGGLQNSIDSSSGPLQPGRALGLARGVHKWVLVGALQLAGLVAYFAAAELLGCA